MQKQVADAKQSSLPGLSYRLLSEVVFVGGDYLRVVSDSKKPGKIYLFSILLYQMKEDPLFLGHSE